MPRIALDWEQLFAHAEWGLVIGSPDGKTLDAMNPAFARMHGYTPAELIGRPLASVFAPARRSDVEEHVHLTHCEGRHIFESEHIRKDGSVFPVQVDATAVKDPGGRVLYRAVYVQDITDRKSAEKALQESEVRSRERLAELELIYATAPVGLALQDRDRRLLRINEHLAAIDGLPVAAHLGQRLSRILPTVARLVDPIVERVIETGESVLEVELSGVTPARPSMTALVSFHPLKSESGVVRAVSIVVQDITARKLAEEAMQRSHNLLRGVIENTSDLVFVKGTNGRYLMMNSAAARIVGRPICDVLGRCDAELFPSELAERFQSDDRRVLAGQEVQEIEQIVPAGSEPRIFMTKKSAWVDEQGRIVGVIGIARDITEREWAEKQLRLLRAENVYLREEMETGLEFGDIVGKSRAILGVLENVKCVAETDSTVLVLGETGTGKELIAKAIHARSRRKDQLLVNVNCAAMPGGLIESELFGHEKGAFTGALSRKIGRFETAHGGTIFLDEIGDLPLELQAKLLRVLQDGEFQRVGGSQALRVDVRVIAATNRDLQRDVTERRFRADLFYRLNVFPIALPPLRERPEDIPLLAQHVAMKQAVKMGKRIECISEVALAALRAYPWPGNVRELQNVIERGVILSRGPELEIGPWQPTAARAPTEARTPTLEESERQHILAVLEQTRWRVSGEKGAARILGINPTTLEARMKKLGIQRPS